MRGGARGLAALAVAAALLLPGTVARLQTISTECAPMSGAECRILPSESGTGTMAFAEEVHTWHFDSTGAGVLTVCLWHHDRAPDELPISFRASVYGEAYMGGVLSESITPATLPIEVAEGQYQVDVDSPHPGAAGRQYGIHFALDAKPERCAEVRTPTPTATPTVSPTATPSPTQTGTPTATPSPTATPRPTGLELLPLWRVLEQQDGHGDKDKISVARGGQPWSFSIGSGEGWRGGYVRAADGGPIDITGYRSALVRAQAAQDGVFYIELKLEGTALHAGDTNGKVRVPLTRGTETVTEIRLVPTALKQLNYLAISNPSTPFDLLAVTLVR